MYEINANAQAGQAENVQANQPVNPILLGNLVAAILGANLQGNQQGQQGHQGQQAAQSKRSQPSEPSHRSTLEEKKSLIWNLIAYLRVESRALTYGWTSIFQIHNSPTGQVDNFLELYGQISIEATYMNANNDRRSQSSIQLQQCIYASLTDAAQAKVRRQGPVYRQRLQGWASLPQGSVAPNNPN